MKQGFSLIEVVIALAIMSVISAVLIPNFNKLQEKAKQTALKSNGYAIQMALESYYLTEGEYPQIEEEMDGLCTHLISHNDLQECPNNPYTSNPYSTQDTSGKIIYQSLSSKGSYELLGYGRNNSEIILRLGTQI